MTAHRVSVTPTEVDWTGPFDDAGYVIVAAGFAGTMEELAAMADPSDAEVWNAIEPHIISRDAHYRARQAARA